MHSSFIHSGLLSCLCLLTSAASVGSTTSPMSWSPDGEWLSYTVAADPANDKLRPGWLFVTARDRPDSVGQQRLTSGRSTSDGPIYRIWATHRDGRTSVLIEESRWPLTAPSWSPQGKSVAFGRFVPISIEATQTVQRGRLEIVIQDGRDRKRVVWSGPEFALDPIARSALPNLSCSWSPDGLYLAVPRLWPQPAVEIVRTDTMKRLHILDHAARPAWSPDGTKIAYFRVDGQRDYLEYVVRHGQNFGESRRMAATSGISAPLYWANDSRSILAVVVVGGSSDLSLSRFSLEPGVSHRVVMSLIPEPARRDGEAAWSIDRF